MNETEYRLYPDGTVLHEDDLNDNDLQSFSDDYRSVMIPDEVLRYIAFSLCHNLKVRLNELVNHPV